MGRMAGKIREKLRTLNPFARRRGTAGDLPQPLPADPDQRLVRVYVEGYEDVAFWRGIFDHFQNPYLRFEISVPDRGDLPKGKKVLLGMVPRSSEELLLCVDSDFDYLFAGRTDQSKEVNGARYMFHTYAYATENYLCYAPSLHNVCVKATKNDTHIFDFVRFMHEYSCTIYPLFLWYAFSAQLASENVFPLVDFKQSVRIGYLDLEENGARTLAWLRRNVEKRERLLQQRNARMIEPMREFEEQLRSRGLKPENTYLFMHGHTLMDNVVLVLLNTVCEKLRQMSIARITASEKRGVALKNEMANYTNSLRSIRDVLLDNENYTKCPLYRRLQRDIERYIVRTIFEMRRRGEIRDQSVVAILHNLRQGQ
ncbi:ABC transporter ATP-binding protein [Alistipes dispar]|uniref:ABC transporter ATP-binding protein n=2 Tax=Alistipes dispar TaxID=2585119 RepID=A0A4Y1X119_9BACT|nr:ABC transporter ATP-binding protein [Alistipes dispar]